MSGPGGMSGLGCVWPGGSVSGPGGHVWSQGVCLVWEGVSGPRGACLVPGGACLVPGGHAWSGAPPPREQNDTQV